MKRVIIAVTNDLTIDQRIHKVALSMIRFGYQPVAVGRKLRSSLAVNRPYICRRFQLLFNKGPLFYFEYNLRLFLYLLFVKAEIFLANDLDTLAATYLAGRIRRKKVVYDSHEYFTQVPELVNRPFIRRIWESIEAVIFPRLDSVYTVNDSIASIYNEKYGVPVKVVRNVPMATEAEPIPGRIPEHFTGHPIILYQGAVNIGRGLEEMIRAMVLLPDCRLLIAGDGDSKHALEELVDHLQITNRVHFTGKLPFGQLAWYTRQATLGMSLEQDIGLNYHYSLPNKVFDYLHAGLPIIASDLPEIRRVVDEAKFGLVIDRFDPDYLSQMVRFMVENPELLQGWKLNAMNASPDFVWESEEEVLKQFFPVGQ